MTTTRFAPSPTGKLHVGNLRTAVMNWMIARKAGGTFILRIDDTDQERSTEAFTDGIRRDLEWLGLTWDREEKQSDRFDRYHAAADRLREAGRLYDCYETPLELDLKRKAQLNAGKPPVYDRAALRLTDAEKAKLAEERQPHQRFLLNQEPVVWDDLIRGPQRIDAASISDPVLFRADGQLLYTLASVVDDAEMGVTHVVRGADHVTNTGAQIQIFEALGGTVPTFAHHSLLTGPEGEALSKRLGTLALSDLREAGVEPMALVSFMARLGASIPIEPLTDMAEIVETFDPSQFNMSPTKFDPEELTLHSAKTLRAMPYEAVAARLPVQDPAFWAAIGPNLDRIGDAEGWWALCQNGTDPVVDAEDAEFVAEAMKLIPPRPWTPDTWGEWTKAVKAATGRKGRGLFQPLRKALTGQPHGPDMGALMPLLQKP
ncbi:glutamate--tRNA ligase [Rhodobacteraceae bacterium NNCM2]|nr:glutamate--tRNA ligase [Coraliihabitans acroporae]